MKKSSTFRLEETTREVLNRLSELTGDSQATLIEKAIELYKNNISNEQLEFMKVYDLVSNNIMRLEQTRDFERDLTEDEKATLNFYYEVWEKMRQQPFFYEKGIED